MNLSIGSKVYHVDYNKNEIVDFEIIGIITRKSSVEYIINDLYKWYENHSYDCYDDDDEINLYVKTKFNDKDPIILTDGSYDFYYSKRSAEKFLKEHNIKKLEQNISYNDYRIKENTAKIEEAKINKTVQTVHLSNDDNFVGAVTKYGGTAAGQYKIIEDNGSNLIIECTTCSHSFNCVVEINESDIAGIYKYVRMVGSSEYDYHHNGSDIEYVRGSHNYYTRAYDGVILYYNEKNAELEMKIKDNKIKLANFKNNK